MLTFVADDGVTLSYRIIGRGRPQAMLVHGWMVTGRVWDWLLRELENTPAIRSREVAFVVPDLRWTSAPGESVAAKANGPTLSLARMVSDLLEVANHSGLTQFHLVGHSMGGQLAQMLACGAPSRVASLALLNSVPVQGLALPAEVAASFRASGGSAEAQGAIIDAACKDLTSLARAALVDDAGSIAPHAIAEVFDLWSTGEPTATAEKIRAKTLVLATDDPFLPASFLRETVAAPIPLSDFRHLPGVGHYPQVERSAECAEILSDFWASR